MTINNYQQLIEHNEHLIEKVARLERKVDNLRTQYTESQVLLEGMSASLQASTIEEIYQSVFATLNIQASFDAAFLLTPDIPGTLSVAAASTHQSVHQKISVDPLLKSVLTGTAKALVDIQLLQPAWLNTLDATEYHSALLASFSYKSSVCLLVMLRKSKGAYLRQDARSISRITGLVEQTLSQVENRFIELEAQQLRLESERVQNNLVQQEKMASLGQLAAGIAHEINNPISFIGSNLQLMQQQVTDLFRVQESLKDQLDPKALSVLTNLTNTYQCDLLESEFNELFADCHHGVERVTHIVKSLKAYCQKNDSSWHLSDVCEGIGLTLKILENQVKNTCQIIEEHSDTPQSYCINNELNQVYLNLLVNAVQSITDNGEILIRSYCQNQKIIIEIHDNGVGIAQNQLDRIFDPFYTTKDVGKGTGLGLSISQAIVKKHLGEIIVSSTVNQGTMFKVILPVLTSPPP
jgi:signal transduction histidine kinase